MHFNSDVAKAQTPQRSQVKRSEGRPFRHKKKKKRKVFVLLSLLTLKVKTHLTLGRNLEHNKKKNPQPVAISR